MRGTVFVKKSRQLLYITKKMEQINKLIFYSGLIIVYLNCFVNTIQGQSLTQVQMQEDLPI